MMSGFYLIKFNQSHHITIEECELFDARTFSASLQSTCHAAMM